MTDEQFDRLITAIERLSDKLDQVMRVAVMPENDRNAQAGLLRVVALEEAGYVQDALGHWHIRRSTGSDM